MNATRYLYHVGSCDEIAFIILRDVDAVVGKSTIHPCSNEGAVRRDGRALRTGESNDAIQRTAVEMASPHRH